MQNASAGFPVPSGSAGYPQPGVAEAGFGFPPAGYPASVPTYTAAQQPFARVPGPAALAAPPQMPGLGAGSQQSVPGVSMAPVAQIAPPAGPGGPHQLPPMPQVPLPQGFPNPFALGQLQQGAPQPGAAPQAPGVVSVTGPMGYLPGLGYFGSTPGAGQPLLPGPAAGSPQAPVQAAASALSAAAPPPTAFPVLPGAIQPQPQQQPQAFQPQAAPPQAFPPQPQQAPASPNPFWVQLAWQLIQTPAVKTALGDRFQQLAEGEDRLRFLQTATACLTGPDLQAAFKALTAGNLDQSRFTTLFADHLVRALGA